MEGQGVALARHDLEVLGLVRLGRPRGDRECRVHHEVDRDDVEHGVGQAGEVRQLAAPVGDDQRVGDLEAVDPTRERVVQRALDDRRTNDRQAVARLRPQLFGGPLGERLGERVDVGPAEALGAGAAVVDESLAHPLGAGGLGETCDGLRSGLAVTGARLREVLAQGLRLARLELDAGAGRLRGLVLGPPVHGMGEGCLGRDALADAAHVGGRDVNHVRVAAAGQQGAVDAVCAADVGVEGLIDGRIERHRRCSVDDHVDIRGKGADVGEAALDHGDALRDGLGRGILTDRFDPVGEDGLAHEVGEPTFAGLAAFAANEDRDAGVGMRRQQSLEHRLSHEPGRAREEHMLVGQHRRGLRAGGRRACGSHSRAAFRIRASPDWPGRVSIRSSSSATRAGAVTNRWSKKK